MNTKYWIGIVIASLGVVLLHLVHVYLLIPNGVFLGNWWSFVATPVFQLGVFAVVLVLIMSSERAYWKQYVGVCLVALILTFPGMLRNVDFVGRCEEPRIVNVFVLRQMLSDEAAVYVSAVPGDIEKFANATRDADGRYDMSFSVSSVDLSYVGCLESLEQLYR